jgi:hypothetical protein
MRLQRPERRGRSERKKRRARTSRRRCANDHRLDARHQKLSRHSDDERRTCRAPLEPLELRGLFEQSLIETEGWRSKPA